MQFNLRTISQWGTKEFCTLSNRKKSLCDCKSNEPLYLSKWTQTRRTIRMPAHWQQRLGRKVNSTCCKALVLLHECGAREAGWGWMEMGVTVTGGSPWSQCQKVHPWLKWPVVNFTPGNLRFLREESPQQTCLTLPLSWQEAEFHAGKTISAADTRIAFSVNNSTGQDARKSGWRRGCVKIQIFVLTGHVKWPDCPKGMRFHCNEFVYKWSVERSNHKDFCVSIR